MTAADFYKQFVGPEDLVFDVGANIGERTEVFAQLARKVIAVEPVEESFIKLRDSFLGWPAPCVLVNKAVGAERGKGTIVTSRDVPTIGTASMAPDWIEAVKKSRRFGTDNKWSKFQNVVITTLDDLIDEYGRPEFIKIDVEGYEFQVMKGLSSAVKALSFEFTPERWEIAAYCVVLCDILGMHSFNLSLGETFEIGEWTDSLGIRLRLLKYIDDNEMYGDIYARMI